MGLVVWFYIALRRILQAVPGGAAPAPQMIEINGQLFHLVPAPQPAGSPPVPPGAGGAVQGQPQPGQPVVPPGSAVPPQPPQGALPLPPIPATPVAGAPLPPIPPFGTPATTAAPNGFPQAPEPPFGLPAGLGPVQTTSAPQPVRPVFVPPPPPLNIPGFTTPAQPAQPAQPSVTTIPPMPVPPGGWPVGMALPPAAPAPPTNQWTPPGAPQPPQPPQPPQGVQPIQPPAPPSGLWNIPAFAPPTTTRAPMPGFVWGAWGQECAAPTGTEQCQVTTEAISDITGLNQPGSVQCNNANDCCMCQSITCGIAGSMSCGTLTLQGENAAFGNKAIRIRGGDPGAGRAKMECTGLNSCKATKVVANGLKMLHCLGRHSCQDMVISIEEPGTEFALECSVTSACEGLTIELNYLPPPSNNVCDPDPASVRDIMLGDIRCSGVDSCKNMKFTVNNNGCNNVIFRNIECRGDTCLGAEFNFFGKSGVGIQSCQLPASSVMPVKGLDRCFTNLRQLTCPDQGSCMNQIRTIRDPINGFFLECTNSMSCAGAEFTFEVSAEVRTPPTEQIRILCNSPMACQGTKVVVNNANQVPVYLEVVCSGQAACDNAVFTTNRNAYLPEVTCGSVEECNNCKFNSQYCGGHAPAFVMPSFGGQPQVIPPNGQPIPPGYAGQLLPGTPAYTPPQPAVPSQPQMPALLTPQFPGPSFPSGPQFPAQPQPQPQPQGQGPVQPTAPTHPSPNPQYTPWWLSPPPMSQGPQFSYNPNPFV